METRPRLDSARVMMDYGEEAGPGQHLLLLAMLTEESLKQIMGQDQVR